MFKLPFFEARWILGVWSLFRKPTPFFFEWPQIFIFNLVNHWTPYTCVAQTVLTQVFIFLLLTCFWRFSPEVCANCAFKEHFDYPLIILEVHRNVNWRRVNSSATNLKTRGWERATGKRRWYRLLTTETQRTQNLFLNALGVFVTWWLFPPNCKLQFVNCKL